MKVKLIAAHVILAMLASVTQAQPIVGFWNVTNVSVGDENMTPVAKWFRFDKDGTATGGNGWTQNSVGTWAYDQQTSEFSATNVMGITDDFGPFKVNFASDTMKWYRQEEGMDVVVSLVAINKWLPAPIDLVKGLWLLDKVEYADGNEIIDHDPEGRHYLFLRPDMRYRVRKPNGDVANGFWHMHGHRPILTLIDYDKTVSNQEFEVSFDGNKLTMQSRNDKAYLYHYFRIHEFPE